MPPRRSSSGGACVYSARSCRCDGLGRKRPLTPVQVNSIAAAELVGAADPSINEHKGYPGRTGEDPWSIVNEYMPKVVPAEIAAMPVPRASDVGGRMLSPVALRRHDWASAVPESCWPTWPAPGSAADYAGYDE